MLALLRRTSFWPLLWSIFQSSLHILQFLFFCKCMLIWPHLPSPEPYRFGSVCVLLHLTFPSFKGVAQGMNIFHMLDLCGQLSCTATMILVQSSTPSYAQGLGVAYLPYARTLTARAVHSNLSLEKPLSLCWDSNPWPPWYLASTLSIELPCLGTPQNYT